MRRHARNLARLVALVVLLLALGACSGDDDGDDGAGGTTSTIDSDGTTTSAVPSGCTGEAPEMSQPANQGEIVDVDGDGQADTAWLASPGNGVRELGVLTAAGGGAKVQIDSASPIALSLLVADADGTPPVELFVSDGRGVQLWAFSECSLQPVVDGQGQPYLFDLGLRGTGTGVGCVDADGDGGPDLVGLNITQNDGTTVDWARTIIERDGLQASNGATDTGQYHQPQDAAAIELLNGVSCGEATIADGIMQPEF
jgi:hypothetical protein